MTFTWADHEIITHCGSHSHGTVTYMMPGRPHKRTHRNRPPETPCYSRKVMTSPAVNHSLPPPAMAPVASPLVCVSGSMTGLMVHV